MYIYAYIYRVFVVVHEPAALLLCGRKRENLSIDIGPRYYRIAKKAATVSLSFYTGRELVIFSCSLFFLVGFLFISRPEVKK